MEDPIRLIIYIVVLVFSCVFHECAHVWTAWKMGDPTGRSMGRLTLNPVPHIDLFWTILLPLAMYLTTDGRFVIGGPKPAPVNPSYFRNPQMGSMLSGMAGPASNLLMGALALGVFWLLRTFAPDTVVVDGEKGQIMASTLLLFTTLFVNVILMAVNLIPIPPLDGSRLLRYILGRHGDAFFQAFDRFALFAVLGIMVAFYYLAPYFAWPFIVGLQWIMRATLDDNDGFTYNLFSAYFN